MVKTLEATLAIQPDHPLACHLYIHAVEASPHPEKALPAADRLRFLQPGLPHLVHMPSHIDVRLGRWKEAVEANERAIAADRAYRAIRPTQGFYRLYMLHDQHLLAFAALMRGESQKAIRTIDAMLAEVPIEWARENAAIVDGIFAMPLEVRMRFGRWDEILAAPEPEASFPIARALRHAARGVAFAATGQVEQAHGAQKEFRAARTRVAEEARFGNSKASTILDVAEHLLAGEILYREGKAEAAFDELEKAVQAEDTLNYYEPPDWILPVRHALGAALMKSGRHERGGSGLPRRPEAVAAQRLVAVRPDAGPGGAGQGRGGEGGAGAVARGLEGRGCATLLIVLLPLGRMMAEEPGVSHRCQTSRKAGLMFKFRLVYSILKESRTRRQTQPHANTTRLGRSQRQMQPRMRGCSSCPALCGAIL